MVVRIHPPASNTLLYVVCAVSNQRLPTADDLFWEKFRSFALIRDGMVFHAPVPEYGSVFDAGVTELVDVRQRAATVINRITHISL